MRCCSTENNLLSQARHIAFVAGRQCYALYGSPTSHDPRYRPLALSPEFGFGIWKYIYEQFLYINPVIESVSYVVGRTTINKTGRSYSEMSTGAVSGRSIMRTRSTIFAVVLRSGKRCIQKRKFRESKWRFLEKSTGQDKGLVRVSSRDRDTGTEITYAASGHEFVRLS
ncbi:hypothetical protein BPOR_0149g00110 [Botrytis porri]|uniref:Uncharacterized protein n=1 Tax=Botrytis porri TaxID=87229 RepID=A0A4Z1KVW4_9HELO|nr:hypothetical protein BPOR_0149g00110 [Botrytis porri]